MERLLACMAKLSFQSWIPSTLTSIQSTCNAATSLQLHWRSYLQLTSSQWGIFQWKIIGSFSEYISQQPNSQMKGGPSWSGSTVVCVPQLVHVQSDSSQLNGSFIGGFVLGDERSDEGILTRICRGIEIERTVRSCESLTMQ